MSCAISSLCLMHCRGHALSSKLQLRVRGPQLPLMAKVLRIGKLWVSAAFFLGEFATLQSTSKRKLWNGLSVLYI